MKKTTKDDLLFLGSAIIAGVFVSLIILPYTLVATYVAAPEAPRPTLTHQQETWLAALEWCESRGDQSAINPEDLDGTPSYGAYQFKPSTLQYYGTMYGIVSTSTKVLVMDYDTQRAVVEAMVRDSKHIEWAHQFPWCVRKLGVPPLSTV